jgi:hypothetical protein
VPAPLNNTFEGGSNGTTLTAGSGGNTGGASGDFFDTVTIGASCTETFATSSAFHGGLGLQITQPVTAAATFVEWNTQLGTVTSTVWGRVYLRLSAGSFSTALAFARTLNGATIAGQVIITSAAKVRCQDNLAATAVGAVTVAVNTWYRIEWMVTIGSGATQTVQAKLYLGDADGDLETITLGSATTQTQATKVQLGECTGPIPSSTLDLDAFNVNLTGFPGADIGGLKAVPAYLPLMAAGRI